jgi:hypothetical protein
MRVTSKERTPQSFPETRTRKPARSRRRRLARQWLRNGGMAIDRYTRIVLTVIAVCLVYLCLRDAAPPVRAQAQPQRPLEVVVVGVDRVKHRFDQRWDDLVLRANEPLKVDTNTPLTVRFNEPLKIDTSTPLKVKVDPYPPIDVKVTNSPLNVNVTNANR